MTLTEKVAYLKGLVEGIGVDETTNQGKIMKAELAVLDDMSFLSGQKRELRFRSSCCIFKKLFWMAAAGRQRGSD